MHNLATRGNRGRQGDIGKTAAGHKAANPRAHKRHLPAGRESTATRADSQCAATYNKGLRKQQCPLGYRPQVGADDAPGSGPSLHALSASRRANRAPPDLECNRLPTPLSSRHSRTQAKLVLEMVCRAVAVKQRGAMTQCAMSSRSGGPTFMPPHIGGAWKSRPGPEAHQYHVRIPTWPILPSRHPRDARTSQAGVATRASNGGC